MNKQKSGFVIDMKGIRVLVTGASRGIGRAIAKALAVAGATVAIHFRSSRSEAENLAIEIGNGARAFQGDLDDSRAVVDLFSRITREMKGIDVLVNNAGIALESPEEMLDEAWLEKWENTQRVNLTAPALLCRAAIRHFLPRGGGRIINIASRAAFRGDTIDYFAYAASKGGLVSLTRSIARGYGKRNIKAFVVAPGFVRTDMSRAFFDTYGEDIAMRDIALNELTEPENIAPVVVMLASGLADHATGCAIDINAGSYVR